MKNDVGNVVSDADGMKNIWRKYMEKLLNVENDCDGEVDCPEVMGFCCLILEEEVATADNGLKMGKAASLTGVVSEMMKASYYSMDNFNILLLSLMVGSDVFNLITIVRFHLHDWS